MRFKKYIEELCCGGDCGHPESEGTSLIESNVFRVGSQKYFEYFRDVREDYKNGSLKEQVVSPFDVELLESDLGEYAQYEGANVPLDCPLFEEDKKPLNKPMRGGPKKFYVYVRDGDSIKKVTFGDSGKSTGGRVLKVKLNDPGAKKSFVARHKCDQQKDKTSAAYWSCRLPYYGDQLGISGGGNFFW